MQPEKLIEVVRGHKVFIQTHNCPDPDAIATAFGLQQFLREYGIGRSSQALLYIECSKVLWD